MLTRKNRFYEKFIRSGEITDWLDYCSSSIWDDIKANFLLGDRLARINEVEFTNRLCRDLSILIANDKIQSPIRLWHAKNEKANGNDLEIVVEVDSDRYLVFPCQCKRIFRGTVNTEPKYRQIWHSSDEYGFQIQNLLEYAEKVGGIPIYLFFNYIDDVNFSEDYGITVCDGAYIAKQYYFIENYPSAISFKNVHPPAQRISDFIKNRGLSTYKHIKYEPKLYSSKDLDIIPGWMEINPPIEYSDGRYVALQVNSENSSRKSINFTPKFRIMFTISKFQHRIINWR